MNPNESFSFNSSNASNAVQNNAASQVELLALEQVLEQDNIELLKQQLAAAHQLLQYQQGVVNSLTEQVTLKDKSLLQVQHKAHDLKRQCDSQQVELSEVQSVCDDLRGQLKRQQRRHKDSTTVAPQHPAAPVFDIASSSLQVDAEVISFGYESSGLDVPKNPDLTKAPPVEAWSSHCAGIVQEERLFCQKLTTFVMKSSERVRREVNTVTLAASRLPLDSHAVELPDFAVG